MLLSEILSTVTRVHPSRPALRMNGQSLSYAQVYTQVDHLAGALTSRHVKPGQRVALLGPACPELCIAEFAAIALGAIPFGIFHQLALPEIQAIVADADPSVLVYTADMASIAEKLDAPSLQLRICCEEGSGEPSGPPSLAHFAAGAAPLRHWYQASPDATALLMYTGGTTGRSKGVMHTHKSIRHWLGVTPLKGFGMEPDNKSLIANVAHISGQFSIWTAVAAGRCMVFSGERMLDANRVVDLIEEEQLTHISLLGTLLRDVVNLPHLAQHNLSSVQLVGRGGSATSSATLAAAVEAFPQAVIVDTFAQTESGIVVTAINVTECVKEGKDPKRLNSAGTASAVATFGQVPMALRILDAAGHEVPTGEIGEVVCQGPQMMSGYWQNPEATQATLRDGWLHTGDLGYVDDEGYLYLVDRIKDMVIVGASNVYTSEVERVLVDHPAIAEMCVLGMPLPGEGEEVTAVIVLRPDTALSLQEIWQHCDGKIARYKFPTRVEYVDALPRTPVSKINKVELQRRFVGTELTSHATM
jgi:long-chain acyl-CoA synthetase